MAWGIWSKRAKSWFNIPGENGMPVPNKWPTQEDAATAAKNISERSKRSPMPKDWQARELTDEERAKLNYWTAVFGSGAS